MTRSRSHVAGIAVLVLLVTALAVGAIPAWADEPCVELKLSGGTVLELPCPEEFARLLDALPAKPIPGEDEAMAIEPDWPHDQAMIAEHDWPYDEAMIVPRAESNERQNDVAPLIEGLLGLLDRHLSRQPDPRPPAERRPLPAGSRNADR